MVRGIAGRVKPAVANPQPGSTPKGTLLLGVPWFAHVWKKAGIGGPKPRKVVAGLAQAQRTIDGMPDFAGVGVLLAVILPPANGAKSQGAGRFQRLSSAAWAAKANLNHLHAQMDAEPGARDDRLGNLRQERSKTSHSSRTLRNETLEAKDKTCGKPGRSAF